MRVRSFHPGLAAAVVSVLPAAAMLFMGSNPVNAQPTKPAATSGRTFEGDVKFLEAHTKLVLLGKAGGPQVAVAPGWQGRVMTSSAGGKDAAGYGWINDELISSGKSQKHIMPWGGEDRFWMGPEGGQFAIFFPKGVAFDFEHWQTPPVIDTDAYDVAAQSESAVTFKKSAEFDNYSGMKFNVHIDRTVRLLGDADIKKVLGVDPGKRVRLVAYESENKLTNAGKDAWSKDHGLLSIWILGMFKHSPTTTVVVPYEPGSEAERGPVVNDMYFGKVPAERLKVTPNTLFFKGDGQLRSKIGVPPQRAKAFLGSYDPARNLLTIVHYTLPAGATDYVNSMWEQQKQPFAGDVVNSYNDGPAQPGAKPLGPFYELETSSPAAALKPGETATHVHQTFHFEGTPAELDPIAKKVLGVGLDEIKNALK